MRFYLLKTGAWLLLALSLSMNTLYAEADKSKKAVSDKELSCSKQARRVHKITDRQKKREFIKKCQAEREARKKASIEAERLKKQKKREKEKATLKAILQGGAP